MRLAGWCDSIACFNVISDFSDNFTAQNCQYVVFQLRVEKCVLNTESLCHSFVPVNCPLLNLMSADRFLPIYKYFCAVSENQE